MVILLIRGKCMFYLFCLDLLYFNLLCLFKNFFLSFIELGVILINLLFFINFSVFLRVNILGGDNFIVLFELEVCMLFIFLFL